MISGFRGVGVDVFHLQLACDPVIPSTSGAHAKRCLGRAEAFACMLGVVGLYVRCLTITSGKFSKQAESAIRNIIKPGFFTYSLHKWYKKDETNTFLMGGINS
jgi:hypothetical protein